MVRGAVWYKVKVSVTSSVLVMFRAIPCRNTGTTREPKVGVRVRVRGNKT